MNNKTENKKEETKLQTENKKEETKLQTENKKEETKLQTVNKKEEIKLKTVSPKEEKQVPDKREENKGRIFGDEHFLYEGEAGSPKYENIDEKWEEVVEWLEKVREDKKEEQGFLDSVKGRVGQEVIKWAKRKDAYAMYMLIKFHWLEFRDTYLLTEGCPEIVLEFIKAIMCKKMTEKQMWGSKADMAEKGKLIIFDKNLIPKEGEDTGELIVEYQPFINK